MLLLVLLVAVPLLYVLLDARLNRVDALADYARRPADTPGTNWLIVGSDSREGLSARERREYATGRAAGRRTDTMMLLHVSEGDDKPTLVSLPRDSYVPIPGHGSGKLNAAFAFGGPRLLVRTVENVTGIHIDHYVEIGFAGFVGIVDAVGGVRICVERPMRDPKAGLNLRRGCQDLNGGEALGYVRTRASALGDLDRVERQRKLLAALMDKATNPGVLLNPFRGVPLAWRGTRAFEVDENDHLHNLVGLAFGMRQVGKGGAVTTTVPIAGFGAVPGAGSVVRWDRDKALRLFKALAEDRPVPKDVIRKR